ncbi:MAG TPA: SemiSWEET transporter [Kofleriaceae bacterium]
MNGSTVVEVLAAVTTVCAFLPQAVKILKTKNVKDLSTAMWVLQVIGFALWVTYGITTKNWPIIVPNAITFLFSCGILGLKLSPSTQG